MDRLTPRLPAGPRSEPREDPDGDAAAYAAGGSSAAARRHRARVTVHAPTAAVPERINPAVGTVEPVDAETCGLDTGADSLDSLGFDFTVTEPVSLVAHLREPAARHARSEEGSSPAASSR
ncbi:hypothetical protein [Streptomyces sp. JH34]|uniref:hypothetical protein n=1 Tax=Streptomyces sp. JH34 TaxID=2793633 RepID=UPI0023F7A4D9|nr:hypothetical protein [Streptomyces sp. JH34]MDF6020998.1 hypothetical protein [Streptomyces sp. JH34]